MKQLVKEKDGHPISTARWSKDGGSLFIGYASGKLLRCKVEETRNKVCTHTVPSNNVCMYVCMYVCMSVCVLYTTCMTIPGHCKDFLF